ncbi:MAG: HD-GYP domain-containing protein [Candidatus Omnitrophica bacterium]|nr:HD-GYP domain-containing protein [Candidatus Omnitrophota bacterium]
MKKKQENSKKFLYFFYDILRYATLNIFKERKELLNHILRKIVIFMGGTAGNIRIYNSKTKSLVLIGSYGTSKRYKGDKKSLKIGESISGVVFQKNKLVVVKDLRKSKRYLKLSLALESKMISLISAPLTIFNKKLGVFSLYYSYPKNFTQLEKEIFKLLANFVSLIISTQNIYYELSDAYVGIIKMIIKALEEKDLYLKGHSEKVKKYALLIGKKIGLDEFQLEQLSDLTTLHDTGKLLIDEKILNKPGTLDNKEWEIIKKHPETGAKIVSQIRRFKNGISIIKHHHERVNGKGYPNGINGSKIPLLAKIVSVADAIDAMLSPRPYRKPLSIEEVKQELIKNSGTQFDPQIVKVALELINEGKIK